MSTTLIHQLSQSQNDDHADLVRPLSEGTISISRTAWTTLRLTWLTWNLTSMNPFTAYRLKAELQRSTSPPFLDARMITNCIYLLDKFCSWWAIDLTRPYFVKFFSVLFCLYLKANKSSQSETIFASSQNFSRLIFLMK